MAREPPEAAAQELLAVGGDGHGRDQAEQAPPGRGLEQELLQVGAARQDPAGEEEDQRQRQQRPRRVRVGPFDDRPQADAVEERIEDEAAPAELEADALGEEVVGVEVHLFEDEVLGDEEGEEHGVEQDAGRRIVRVAKDVVRGERQHVQLEHHRAHEVEEHLGVDAAAGPLRVVEAAEVEIGEQRAARARRQHDGEREGEAERARARRHRPALAPEEIPGDEPALGGQRPQRDGDHEDAQAVEPIAQRSPRLCVAHVAVDPAPGDDDVEDEDEGVDEKRKREAEHRLPWARCRTGGPV